MDTNGFLLFIFLMIYGLAVVWFAFAIATVVRAGSCYKKM